MSEDPTNKWVLWRSIVTKQLHLTKMSVSSTERDIMINALQPYFNIDYDSSDTSEKGRKNITIHVDMLDDTKLRILRELADTYGWEGTLLSKQIVMI